jgi:hypothetical protein
VAVIVAVTSPPIGIEQPETGGIDEVKRRAPPRACFGEEQRSVGEVECGQSVPTRNRRSLGKPLQATGNHQVHHEMETIVEVHHDPLPKTPGVEDDPICGGIDRRVVGPKHRDAPDPYAEQGLSHDPRPECVEIRLDLRKFGHTETVDQEHDTGRRVLVLATGVSLLPSEPVDGLG